MPPPNMLMIKPLVCFCPAIDMIRVSAYPIPSQKINIKEGGGQKICLKIFLPATPLKPQKQNIYP
jgi:hypothetical protein